MSHGFIDANSDVPSKKADALHTHPESMKSKKMHAIGMSNDLKSQVEVGFQSRTLPF